MVEVQRRVCLGLVLTAAACGSSGDGDSPMGSTSDVSPMSESGDETGDLPGSTSGEDTEADESSSSGEALGVDLSAFEAEVEQFLADHGLEGATAVVVHAEDGVLLERGFGTFETDRVSLLASASKMVTAGVIVRLHDQGVIDLDAPISTYLSDWEPREHDPTLAQLISNSSGMPGLTDAVLYGPYLCQYFDTGSLTECGETIYTADDLDDLVPPDTAFRYGGGQWQLAGAVAVVAAGMSWDALVEATYGDACGVTHLGYTNPFQESLQTGGVDGALGYPTWFDGDLADLPVTDNPNMEGGAYTTIGDYGQLLLMHVRDGECSNGRVLEAESARRMRQDRVARWGIPSGADTGLDGYGLGLWTMSAHPGLATSPGAFGSVPWFDSERGYGAMLILEAETEYGLLALDRLRPVLETAFDGAE